MIEGRFLSISLEPRSLSNFPKWRCSKRKRTMNQSGVGRLFMLPNTKPQKDMKLSNTGSWPGTKLTPFIHGCLKYPSMHLMTNLCCSKMIPMSQICQVGQEIFAKLSTIHPELQYFNLFIQKYFSIIQALKN